MRTAVLLALAAVTGCAASSLRESVTPPVPNTRKAAPWSLNRELLTPQTKRIQLVVEVLEGHWPEVGALDDLALVAARYGGRPASWTIHPRDQELKLERDVSYVIIKYVGNQLDAFGRAYARMIDGRPVYFIIVNQERHRRWRILMPERRLEEQTLVHEYGHDLGLPTYEHGYYPHYPELTDGLHCVNPDCALSKPRPRAVLYSAFHVAFGRDYLTDYCEECRKAISLAQAYWREHP